MGTTLFPPRNATRNLIARLLLLALCSRLLAELVRDSPATPAGSRSCSGSTLGTLPCSEERCSSALLRREWIERLLLLVTMVMERGSTLAAGLGFSNASGSPSHVEHSTCCALASSAPSSSTSITPWLCATHSARMLVPPEEYALRLWHTALIMACDATNATCSRYCD